ncbi:MAG: hormogonium polysaccharide biosynthesis glycosyltransferase HpsP [Elainellaceae cyanobacterium]
MSQTSQWSAHPLSMIPSLKILQIVPSVSLVYGGPSQMVLGFSKALADEGAEVTILTTDSNGDTGQVPLDVPLDRPVEQDGYQIHYFHCSPFRRYKFSLGLFQWLTRHAKEYDIAHIHALFSPVSSLSAAIARSHALPYILRPLGTLDPADLRKKRRLKQLYATALERPNLAGAAAIHFTSKQEATISERFGLKTHDWVLPLGVDLPNVLPDPQSVLTKAGISISPHRPLILFMSRIDPKKGLDLLIPALETCFTDGHDFQVVFAGSNPQDPAYEDFIRHSIQSSPLATRTTITGFVSGECKAALLQRADVFVLPSYYENFGIAVAEAMAAKTPVLISDQVHIYPDVQRGDAGWICECTPSSLADQLKIALSSADERQRKGANAQQYAQAHYGWRAIARQAVQRYHMILEKSNV